MLEKPRKMSKERKKTPFALVDKRGFHYVCYYQNDTFPIVLLPKRYTPDTRLLILFNIRNMLHNSQAANFAVLPLVRIPEEGLLSNDNYFRSPNIARILWMNLINQPKAPPWVSPQYLQSPFGLTSCRCVSQREQLPLPSGDVCPSALVSCPLKVTVR